MATEKGRVLLRATALLAHLAPIPACLGTAFLLTGKTPSDRWLAGGLLVLAIVGAIAGVVGASRRSLALDRLVRWAGEFGLDLSAHPPRCGSATDVAALVDALLNMAQRVRRANGRLARSERRTRELLESMSEGFVVVDRGDRIRYANPAFAAMLGVPVESIVGLDLDKFLDEDSHERVNEQTDRRRAGKPGRYDLTWLRPDGGRLDTLVSASAIFGMRGRYQGSFGVITDLTERKRLERQMAKTEKFRALGELAGGVAHDFNNRLTAILGNAQLLLLDKPPEKIATPLRVIEQASLQGAETVRRILEFSRTKPGGDPEDVRIDDLVGEVIDLMRYREEAKSGLHRIRRDLRSNRPVSGHPGELREAILNLLVNAVDAMPDGGDLTVRTRDGEGGVEIRVTDSGHGMDAETQERALDPFFTTRGTRRTGLGLPLAWGIVGRHGGRLHLESEPDRGTVVTVLLPAVAAAPCAPSHGTRATRSARRALVVDDEEPILRMLRFALGQHGYRVDDARTGPEGLARAVGDDEFDLLVTDLRMPGVSGVLIAEEARRLRPHLRVVVITGAGRDEIREVEKHPAVDRVLAKPFDIGTLEDALGLSPSPR